MNITEQIEDLIGKNATDFEISKLFKAYIADYKKSLPELFEQNQGKDFLVKHTKALDKIIHLMYKTVLRQMFGNYLPMRNSIPVAVIALGSYGREQLCVHSDIDLMLVFEKCEGYNTNTILEKLLYLAWDAGLKLGHRVHESNKLLKASREDITIRTAMMESRFITGSAFVWHAVQRQLTAIRHDDPKSFILAKIDEAHARRKKYPSSMQPNIKESVGGLRDSQLLFWVAYTIYGVNSIKNLTSTLISEDAYREYRIALELLFRVRSALHLASGKQQDQLIFQYMPQIADMLGFSNERKMSSKILEAMWQIDNFTQIFVKKMIRPYLYEPSMITKLRQSRIAPGYFAINDRLYTTYDAKPRPIEQLLELLNSLEDKEWRLDPSFINRFIYAKIKHPLNKKSYSILKKLLKREHLYPFLRLFYRAGILNRLFSPFGKVTHLPQFDGYHHYPVDVHSIECYKVLENIKDPFIADLYNTLNKEDRLLIKLVVLLHDTGKGRKLDHSEVGAKLIVPFIKKMHLSDEAASKAALLVKHHVLMSAVAFRENLHNEKTLYRFMSNVKNKNNLKLLYILTYADINGVGPGIYTSFSAKLLRELYDTSLDISDQTLRISDASKRSVIEKRIIKLDTFKALPKTLQKKILSIESNLFFFRHSPRDIVQIAIAAKEVKKYSYQLRTNEGLRIEIIRKTPLNLSYLLGRLSYMDVVSMDVFTLFDGLKYFKLEFVQEASDDMLETIREVIDEAFDMERTANLEQPVIYPREITIDCEHSKAYAALAVHTANQRGLLAFIIHCIDEADMMIATAKIDTTKKRARDHFLIEKEADICDNSKQLITLLTKGSRQCAE